MYHIKKCRECNAYVHIHKHNGYYTIRNTCEHVPKLDRATNKDIRRYLS